MPNLHTNDMFDRLPSPVVQPSLLTDIIGGVSFPTALPSGSLPTAQTVSDELLGSSRHMVITQSMSQMTPSGESDQLHNLLMWMSSFVSFTDNFKKCISAGLNVGALPTVDVRPPAHIPPVEDIAVLPLLRLTTHTVPESFKEAIAYEICPLGFHLSPTIKN